MIGYGSRLGWMLVAVAFGLSAAAGGRPFQPGEKLVYGLRWGRIPAGSATFEVKPSTTHGGSEALHFVMSARSNAVVDKVYKVRDRIDAYTDAACTRSLFYTKNQREGKHRKQEAVRFDWDAGQVRMTDRLKGKERDPVEVPPGTFDPLSMFYNIRCQGLSVGQVLTLPVTDGRKVAEGQARVVRKETITVRGKKHAAYLIEPDIKDLGGVFRKSEKARLQVWVSADGKGIPLRIRSKVVVGHFVAELVSATSGAVPGDQPGEPSNEPSESAGAPPSPVLLMRSMVPGGGAVGRE